MVVCVGSAFRWSPVGCRGHLQALERRPKMGTVPGPQHRARPPSPACLPGAHGASVVTVTGCRRSRGPGRGADRCRLVAVRPAGPGC